MVIVVTVTRVQILDESDCISHSTNTLGKGMNPIILPPAMYKIVGRHEFKSWKRLSAFHIALQAFPCFPLLMGTIIIFIF